MALSPTPIRLGILGQSFGEAVLRDPLKSQIINGLRQRFSRVTMAGWAVGGSVSDKSHAGGTTRYWWDLVTNKPGPCMVDWMTRINALPITDRPNHLVVNLGEGDSMWAIPGSEQSAEVDVFARAMRALIAQARVTCSPTAPNTVMVLLFIIGRRIYHLSVPGVQAIREAQLRMMVGPDAIPNCYNLASIWDVELVADVTPGSDDSHPTVAGYADFGRRFVDRFSWVRGGLGGQMALRAMTARQTAPDSIQLDLVSATASEVLTPSLPYGIGLRSGADTWTGSALQYAWAPGAGTTKQRLTITAPRSITGKPTVLYPYGQLNGLDRSRIVTDQLGEPIEPFLFDVEAPLLTDADAALALASLGSTSQALYKLARSANLIPPLDKGS